MPATRRHWTTADVRALMDESRHWPRYELIDGELLVTPAPGVSHQVAALALVRVIADHVDRENLGNAMMSPADIELRTGNITQPDVFVVPTRVTPPLSDKRTWGDVRSLLLAVEIISPSSVRADRVTKRDYYLDAGVPEYWVVDLDARIVERWTPARNTPRVEAGRFEWSPAGSHAPLVIDAAELFDRVAGNVKRI